MPRGTHLRNQIQMQYTYLYRLLYGLSDDYKGLYTGSAVYLKVPRETLGAPVYLNDQVASIKKFVSVICSWHPATQVVLHPLLSSPVRNKRASKSSLDAGPLDSRPDILDGFFWSR